MFVTPCFLSVPVISSSVAMANSLFLITPLGVFSLSCGYTLHLVLWKLYIFRIFSAFLQLGTLTSKFMFLDFVRFFGVALDAINFSMRKGENLARQTSTKDSMMMNLIKVSRLIL